MKAELKMTRDEISDLLLFWIEVNRKEIGIVVGRELDGHRSTTDVAVDPAVLGCSQTELRAVRDVLAEYELAIWFYYQIACQTSINIRWSEQELNQILTFDLTPREKQSVLICLAEVSGHYSNVYAFGLSH